MTDSPPEGSSADGRPEVAEFERIDWDRHAGGTRLTPERTALVLGLCALVAVYAFHRTGGGVYLVWWWSVGPADWLLLLATVVLIAYGVVPLARSPRAAGRLLARLRGRRLTALAVAYLSLVVLIGTYGIVGFQPGGLLDLTLDRFQPPVWETVPYRVTQSDCVGHVSDGWDPHRPCHGTWQYPLGTDRWGYDVINLLWAGARPVVYMTVVTAGLIVPLATVVGLVSGYYGGLADDLLMGYVDAQLSVPAIVLYLIAWMYIGGSLFVLLVAFGLLSWGGVARIVRSETLQRREEGYVLSARAAGATSPYVLRRHVLPNVTDTVVPSAFHLAAVLVLTEAGLSFLGFHSVFQSWGMTIADGLFRGPAIQVWWTSTFPAIALALTVASLKIAGDGLRDALDPRREP